jgi:undecaprenyl diphosphate synthase
MQAFDEKLPKHVAIIMDGNGRWAQSRGLPRTAGHEAGVEAARKVVKECLNLGIKYLTLYAFSSENWQRPEEEVQFLMHLLKEYIRKETDSLLKNNIKLKIIGRMEGLPEDLRQLLLHCMQKTQRCKRMQLNVALNYGGRQEIVDAAKRLYEKIKEGKETADFDERTFCSYLYTASIPDPDLLIRTSGEQRVSNFLLWQIAYTEIYITKVLWPDFGEKELHQALAWYEGRHRRFGRI